MNVQAIAIDFADRLCRERPLTDDETERLCEVIRIRSQRVHRLWTVRDDRELLRLFRKRMNAVQIAERVGRTAFAVRRRKAILRSMSHIETSDAD